MNTRTNILTCSQVNETDMVDYLLSLGHSPTTIRNDDYWYRSPFREEKTPSRKTNRCKNVWHDPGKGKEENRVDRGILYHQCSVKEFLDRFNAGASVKQHFVKMIARSPEPAEHAIKIIAATDFLSLSLLRYFTQRRINETIGRKYCLEVSFLMNQKEYSAIGHKNDAGGFELRNQWSKRSSTPKTFTTIKNTAKTVAVFESFFDFLSYQSIHQNQTLPASDFLILNAVALIQKAIPVMKQYEQVKLFLDRDKPRQNCSTAIIATSKKYADESSLYNGYKDLNEWTLQIGKSKKIKMFKTPKHNNR